MQEALGQALARSAEPALAAYVDSIALDGSDTGGRECVARCLTTFRPRAAPARRLALWRRAFEAFTPPAWFGPEITTDPSFGRQVISLNRMPDVGEVPLSNGIVEDVLDILEGRADDQPVATPARLRAVETSVFDALRRLTASVGSQTASPEAHEAGPEPAMPDIDLEGTYAEAEEASEPAQHDEARPADADPPSRPSKIRPRLFPRRTH
jgi:hypothetical protein